MRGYRPLRQGVHTRAAAGSLFWEQACGFAMTVTLAIAICAVAGLIVYVSLFFSW